MEISFRVADHIDTTLGKSKDPKEAWDCLAKHYGTGQDGLQSILIMKLQLMKWDGSGSIFTHRDAMVNLRTELADTGMVINDHTFFSYFTSSLPRSLDLFITLYDDGRSHDINVICDRFARYEMRLKLDDTRIAKNDGVPDTPVVMFSQASSSNPKGKKGKGRDFKNVTCYGCGKKGHIKAKCQDKPKEAKETKAGEKKDDKSKPAKAVDDAHKVKPTTGTLYMALTLGAQAGSGDSDGHFYIDSGASDHLFPTKGDLHAYRKFIKPVEISAADGGKIYAYGSGTLKVATSANGLERETKLNDVYYTPAVQARLVSLGKLEGQGWDVCLREGRMELRNQEGDLFAQVEKVDNVYPAKLDIIPPRAGLAAWTASDGNEATHSELAE